MKNLKSKIVLAGAAVIFSSFFLPSSAFSKGLKIGVVNVNRIYVSYKKAQESYIKFQGKRKKMQKEYNSKLADLKQMIDNYNKNKSSMSKAQRKEALTKIVKERNKVQTFLTDTDKKLVKENQQTTKKRLEEIETVIQTYAKDNGFDIIIDKKSLPFFSKELNITDQIINILNK
jgi:outer membrane protein